MSISKKEKNIGDKTLGHCPMCKKETLAFYDIKNPDTGIISERIGCEPCAFFTPVKENKNETYIWLYKEQKANKATENNLKVFE